MNRKQFKRQPVKQQRGFVLILALVLLAVMTLIGVSSMNSANIELKVTANAQQYQCAFNATQSLLESAISKPSTGVIDYQTSEAVAQNYNGNGLVLPCATALTATVNYVGCAKGTGGSLEAGRGFSYNYYNINGSGSNKTKTSVSNQTLGVRYPSAC